MSSGELCNAEMIDGKSQKHHCENWKNHEGKHSCGMGFCENETGEKIGATLTWPNLENNKS